MSGITSGYRGCRDGRPAVESLPEARLTYRSSYFMDQRGRPLVIVQSEGLAIVKFGLREWSVLIETSPCHFGGSRRWLVCSACQTKRVALYVLGSELACRECLGLRYECQHETTRARAYRRVNAIRERLNWRPGIAHPNGPKPPKMHWSTFVRLVAAHDALAAYLLGNVNEWIDRAEISLGKSGQRQKSTIT